MGDYIFIVPALLGRHQDHLLERMGGRRLCGRERQLQVTDDPVTTAYSVRNATTLILSVYPFPTGSPL